jgi:hypothetical protein
MAQLLVNVRPSRFDPAVPVAAGCPLFSRFGLAVACCLAATLGVVFLPLAMAAPVRSQFRVSQGTYVPPAQTRGVAFPAVVPAPAPVAVPTPVPVPVPAYRQAPLNGYPTGPADLSTANTQYGETIPQAKLAQEDVSRSRSDTRRKMLDEMRYEYEKRPTQEKMLAEERAARLTRSRNNPPNTVIWSGDALNDLLAAIQGKQTDYGDLGAAFPLDSETLQHINLSAGTTPGTVGLFRQARPLRWPLPLTEDRFDSSREKIEALSTQVIQSVVLNKPVLNKPDAKAMRDLLKAISSLKDEVTAATKDQSPSDNIKSMRYVKQLYEAAQSMTDPNAVFFFNGKWSAQGSTVPELIAYMTANGLRFAPASEGDEPYYSALYRSMLDYDAGNMKP